LYFSNCSFRLNSTTGDVELYYSPFYDPTTLANSIWKLRKGYYETIDNPLSVIIPSRYRGVNFTVLAALDLMDAIGCEINDRVEMKSKLTSLAQNTTYLESFLERQGEVPDAPEFEVDEEVSRRFVVSEAREWPNYNL
jgi:hypothetical protein